MKPENATGRVRTVVLGLCAVFLAALIVPPDDANASHFRYGTISYVPVLEDGQPTGTVEFRFAAAFRRSGYSGTGADNRPVVGDIITETVGGTTLQFGDGTGTSTLRFRVIAFSATEDWIVGEALHPGTEDVGVRKTYSGQGPYTARSSTCCRIGALNNRGNGTYTLTTTVHPFSANRSPISQQFPIVTVPEGRPRRLPSRRLMQRMIDYVGVSRPTSKPVVVTCRLG
jgi:hypothetical protein